MIEKFFKLKNDGKLYKDFIEYAEEADIEKKQMKIFLNENGIKTKQYGEWLGCLCIVPTSEDMENFEKQLKKDSLNGIAKSFKKNSKINKKYIEFTKDFKKLRRPEVWMYMKNFIGSVRTEVKSIGEDAETIIMKLTTEHEYEITDIAEEIKASEYYLLLEGFENGIHTKEVSEK